MGKNSIVRFLAAVPVTASIAINTTIYQNKNDIQLDLPTNIQQQVENNNDKNLKIELLPEPAIDVSNNPTAKNGSIEPSENTLTVSEKQPQQEKATVIVAESKGAKGKKLNIKKEKAENEKSTKDPTKEDKKDTDKDIINDGQLAAMEKMVSGYPIEKMLPHISKRRPETAAFLVAIAKKESNWGKRSPRSAGGDCFNYWGFKDHRFPFVAGHSCFPSAETAVETVGNRIDKLVSQGRNTPAELVIWKCGSACAKDGNKGKWISDVGLYFNPIIAATPKNDSL